MIARELSRNPTPSQVVVEVPSSKRAAVTMTANATSHGTASGNPTKLIN